MGQLTNQFVSQSYQGLLNLENPFTGVTNSLQYVTDGLGGNTALQISRTQVNVTGSFLINGVPITNGTSGTSGTSGVAGSSGTSGTSGVSGTNGSSGTSGTSGVSGSSGTSGTSGANGSSGTSGTSGANGSSGTSGTSGVNGSSGTSGTSGVDGSSGTSGTSGSSGTSGTAGTSGDSIFALTGSIWETSRLTKFNADSTFGADLTVLQDINLPSGSSIRLSPDAGGNSAAIRFLSGSNPASNRWVNIQGVPGSQGDVAISDFPSNNHFMFFDMPGHTVQFEAPIRSTGSAAIQITNGVINNTNYTPVQPGVGFINSGSLTTRGDLDVISNNTSLNVDLYYTSSLLGQSNIVLGWNDNQAAGGPGAVQANYTGSLRITGSNNIVSLPQIRATQFGLGADSQGYISGSNNIINGNFSGIYMNTGSLLFPKVAGNFVGQQSFIGMNFTTSSLAGGHPIVQNNTLYGGGITINSNSGSVTAVAGNLLNGGTLTTTQNFVTNTRPAISTNVALGAVTLNHISSSINYQANLSNSPVTVNNALSSSAIANNNVSIANNTFLGGQGNTGASFFISGSQNSNLTRNFHSNLIGGANSVISSSFVSSSNANLLSTIMYGNGLAVSASHTAGTLGGSAFFGRFNMTGSNLEDTQQVVFAVGTGTSAAARRTGFLIDSGSNTRISGSLNVNGNSIITGSLDVTGSVTIANAGDLTMYGHKMFNTGEFFSNTRQSGSAGVSGSLTFTSTANLVGTSLVSNTRLTVANAGIYNVQFSAQIETSAGADTVHIWFKKNGNNINDSATKVVLANNTAQVMTVNILDEAAANDYYELAYQTLNGHATILAETASGNIPAIPSVIATITQAR